MNNYKLINDDCFNYMYELEDSSVDAIITDPPYGVLKHKIECGVDKARFMKECKRVIKPNGFMAFFGQQPTLTEWNYHAFKHFNYKNEVIWYKRQSSSPLLDMNRVIENITICCNGKRRFNDVRISFTEITSTLSQYIDKNSFLGYESVIHSIATDVSRINTLIKFANSKNNDGYLKAYQLTNDISTVSSPLKLKPRDVCPFEVLSKGYKPRNLISFIPHNKQRFDASKQSGGSHNVKHPTVKPIQLMEYIIKLTTNENDVILDPFVGSGTTILAGLNSNRKVIGVEKFRQYHDISQQRINEWYDTTNVQQELF